MIDAPELPGPSRVIAIAAMIGSAACWGGATVMTKAALEAFDPFILLLIQLVASCRNPLGCGSPFLNVPIGMAIHVAGRLDGGA